MRLFARLFRLVWGDEVEPALRPVLAVGLAGSIAFSTGWTFIGIWAVEELGPSSSELGFGFLFGSAADQAMVADLVPPERHEAAYASVRVAHNLGVTMGPPVGGLLLIGENWPALFIGVSALSAVAFAIAWRYLPRRGAFAPAEPPTRVPTSQSIVAGLALEDVRGAYMGAFGSTAAVGFALGPFIGLQVRAAAGDDAMWMFFAGVAVLAAFTGAAAVRFMVGRSRAEAAAATGV